MTNETLLTKDKTGKDAMVRVGLLGFGTVGSAVAGLLGEANFPGIRLTHIYNRGMARKRDSEAGRAVGSEVIWTERVEDVLGSEVDVVVELTGGWSLRRGGFARRWRRASRW